MLLLTLSAGGGAAPVDVGSDAEVWLQQTAAEKAAYLDGLCTGLQAGGQLAGETLCKNTEAAASSRPGLRAHLRLCGIRFRVEGSGNRALPSGVEVLDRFYASADYSDVPVALAIAHYNDQVCHESNAARLPAVQAHRKCVRQLINMRDASPEARAAQDAACKRIR